MPDIKVTTIKGFLNGDAYAKRNSEITVSELRAQDLLRNGLIEDYRETSAPPLQNKMATDPDNKELIGALPPENNLAPVPDNKDQVNPPPPPATVRVLSLKQEGHGKWIIVGEDEKQVGEFVGNKVDTQKELDRLVAEAGPAQE